MYDQDDHRIEEQVQGGIDERQGIGATTDGGEEQVHDDHAKGEIALQAGQDPREQVGSDEGQDGDEQDGVVRQPHPAGEGVGHGADDETQRQCPGDVARMQPVRLTPGGGAAGFPIRFIDDARRHQAPDQQDGRQRNERNQGHDADHAVGADGDRYLVRRHLDSGGHRHEVDRPAGPAPGVGSGGLGADFAQVDEVEAGDGPEDRTGAGYAEGDDDRAAFTEDAAQVCLVEQ